jgi:hypothetical protein
MPVRAGADGVRRGHAQARISMGGAEPVGVLAMGADRLRRRAASKVGLKLVRMGGAPLGRRIQVHRRDLGPAPGSRPPGGRQCTPPAGLELDRNVVLRAAPQGGIALGDEPGIVDG